MLALSTSCLSLDYDNGEKLLQAIEEFGLHAVELEYRITDQMYHQMQKPLRKSGIRVTSVHNYFPTPPIVPRSESSGDLFLLSHPDREERRRAIQWTTRTIEVASDLEAVAVVLHCGYVKMEPEMDRLYGYYDKELIESDEAQEFIQAKLAEREENKPPYLEALMFSLDRIAREADKLGILLGLENRYSYHELPGAKELDFLFREFDGSPLRYWHDTGHAYANEQLTIQRQEDLLKTHADRLIGVHLHDARKTDDHLSPGAGDIDFGLIKDYLKDDTLCVLELKPGTSKREIIKGIEYLRSMSFSE